MRLLPLLLAAHFVGDWIVQTDWQAANKTTSWAAMAQHMLGYHFCILLAVVAAHPPVTGEQHYGDLILVAVSLITHAFLDRRWPVRWLMRHTGSAPFAESTWGVLVVDQACHLSILCVLAAIFAR